MQVVVNVNVAAVYVWVKSEWSYIRNLFLIVTIGISLLGDDGDNKRAWDTHGFLWEDHLWSSRINAKFVRNNVE